MLPLGAALGGLIGRTFDSRTGVAVGCVGLALSALPMLTRRIRTLSGPQDAKPDPSPSPSPGPGPRPADESQPA